ncbi:hypothetical protein HGRIS_011923 [Hohenbuehelia grisea]|uniref:Proliferating cell nuclear antigen PCNA C-terminal domain-containing protein n=1 Tax=Hohenbuehelia grisea TaxID=104357 RepID=A0ABR3JYV8_9AGAR
MTRNLWISIEGSGGKRDVEMNGEVEDSEEDLKPKSDDGRARKGEGGGGGGAQQLEEAQSRRRRKRRTSKDDDEAPKGVEIEPNQHVSLMFSVKYLINFSKSSSLSAAVQLVTSHGFPLPVAFNFGPGFIRYCLAPKSETISFLFVLYAPFLFPVIVPRSSLFRAHHLAIRIIRSPSPHLVLRFRKTVEQPVPPGLDSAAAILASIDPTHIT